jgi:transcriptional regulator with XRE-family HTH domain
MVSNREQAANTRGKTNVGTLAHEIDLRVGQNIRAARIEAGLSQEKLAWNLGKTFQQIQKYEKGTNRVSAGVLGLIARETGKAIGWFYEENDVAAVEQTGEEYMKALKLARRIADLSPQERRALHGLVNAMKRNDDGEDF